MIRIEYEQHRRFCRSNATLIYIRRPSLPVVRFYSALRMLCWHEGEVGSEDWFLCMRVGFSAFVPSLPSLEVVHACKSRICTLSYLRYTFLLMHYTHLPFSTHTPCTCSKICPWLITWHDLHAKPSHAGSEFMHGGPILGHAIASHNRCHVLVVN